MEKGVYLLRHQLQLVFFCRPVSLHLDLFSFVGRDQFFFIL